MLKLLPRLFLLSPVLSAQQMFMIHVIAQPPPFARPVSDEACDQCCDLALQNAVDSEELLAFDSSSCKDFGCRLPEQLPSAQCFELENFGDLVNDEQRRGCELGRDFRFAGFSPALIDFTLVDVDDVKSN